jgi:hypothetical protein
MDKIVSLLNRSLRPTTAAAIIVDLTAVLRTNDDDENVDCNNLINDLRDGLIRNVGEEWTEQLIAES